MQGQTYRNYPTSHQTSQNIHQEKLQIIKKNHDLNKHIGETKTLERIKLKQLDWNGRQSNRIRKELQDLLN